MFSGGFKPFKHYAKRQNFTVDPLLSGMSISKVGFLLLFIVMPYGLCFCQIIPQKSVDSLLAVVKTAPADTFKLNALHQLGNYYHQRRFKLDAADLDSALF